MAVSTVAVDPVHDVAPVKLMQALAAKLTAVQEQAEQNANNERKSRIGGNDGALEPVADKGGRRSSQSLVLGAQSVVRAFDPSAQARLEAAQAGADTRREGKPEALMVSTQQPLDSFDARTWPACYTEFWFGDSAPNLARERPMLFEQVARRLINLEELEYSLAADTDVYAAPNQSRSNTPELIAVLGYVIR